MHLHVQLHHLIHVERIHAPGDGHAQRVADKLPRMMVGEKLRIFLEDRALLGLLDIHLHAQQSLLAHLVQKLVHHLQRAQIALLAEWRSLHDSHQRGRDLLDDVHRIGRQQRADRRPAQNQQLGRLKKNQDVALLHQKAADDRHEDHENAYDGKHSCLPGASVMWFPPA
jgi:hypothetical protein